MFRVIDGASNTALFSNEPHTWMARPTINVNQQASPLKLIIAAD